MEQLLQAEKIEKSKREKFVEMAGGRTDRALAAIAVIEAIGRNSKAYDYDERDVEDICKALNEGVERVHQALSRNKQTRMTFQFRSR